MLIVNHNRRLEYCLLYRDTITNRQGNSQGILANCVEA